jgi:hypothetical protein
VLTVADVERWNAGAVRDVFHAATARGNATLEASRQLSTLSVFDTWEGATAEARKHTNASIRQDLDAHGNESLAVAQAAGKAADDIEKVQSELRTLQHDAAELHMRIDPLGNKIVPAEKMPPMEALIAEMQLQPRLDKILVEANAVDAELAAAINLAEGNAPIQGGPPSAPLGKQSGNADVPPELTQLQRSNDQAVVDAVAKAQAAQKALKDAQSAAAVATYTHGPGSQEADTANALVTARRAELADALAKVDQIPDYSGIDPKSVTSGQGGIAFSYNANGQKVQVSGTLKNGTGELFDQGRLAYYTYQDGKLVGTRFLDPGQAQAVAEPLLSATTAGVPMFKGLKGGWLGLRTLLASQGGDAAAGAAADEGLSHATAMAGDRAATASNNLGLEHTPELPRIPGAAAGDHPVTPAPDGLDHHLPIGPTQPESVGDIHKWLPEINHGPGMDITDPARGVNCGECAAAIEQRLSGAVPDATAGLGTLSIPEMEAATGLQQVPGTPTQIEQYLISRGRGAHTVVGVDRAGGVAGHWFNAYYDGKNVYAIDGQTGQILGWPPNMDAPGYPVTNWDYGVPK